MPANDGLTLQDVVDRCQKVMAHAWMVRTFVKHSPEVEDFPELMGIVRTVFDTSRALETRVADPAGYISMLRKKIGKMKAAAAEFRADVPEASSHTNFAQAVISIETCVEDLEGLLAVGLSRLPSRPALSRTLPGASPGGGQIALPQNSDTDDDTSAEAQAED